MWEEREKVEKRGGKRKGDERRMRKEKPIRANSRRFKTVFSPSN